MFPFAKKKKRKQKPTPTWLMLLVAAFIAYAVFTGDKNTSPPAQNNNINENNAVEPSTATASAPIDKPASAPILGIETDKILDIDVLKGKFTPKSVIKLNVKNNVEGNGQFAVCGQKVTILYSSFTEDKKEIESKQNITFQIGENKVMPALENGVIGMKKSGERTISSPANMAYGAENFLRNDFAAANVNFEVKMLELSPETPDIGAYRILGDGKGPDEGYFCGSQAKLHITLWDVEGKKLYSSRDNNGSPITFTIGKSEVFLGLEQGVLDMLPGMRRNLIVPPAFQKTLLGNAPAINFPLPKNQIVLVDVESIP